MIVRPARFPGFWVDSVRVFTVQDLRDLVTTGIQGVFGYLGSITRDRVLAILDVGLDFAPVTYARKPDTWDPSAALGDEDGRVDVGHLEALELPSGPHVWVDDEGCKGPPAATAAWLDARSQRHVRAGFRSGLYCGAEPGLSAHDAYLRPWITGYWKSFSKVAEPDAGWMMIQLFKTVNLAGGPVDVNAAQYDYRDRLPWVVSAG